MTDIGQIKIKICNQCGRRNSPNSSICDNKECSFYISTHPIIDINKYYCYNDPIKKDYQTDVNFNTYSFSIALHNVFCKLCRKCYSQNYRHNKKCLRCNEILADEELTNDDGIDITEPFKIACKICFNCKAVCKNMHCVECEVCKNGELAFSPVVSLIDYNRYHIPIGGRKSTLYYLKNNKVKKAQLNQLKRQG